MPHHFVDYIELPSSDLNATKAFYQQVFNWQFTDYGPDYCDFSQEGINGGFYRAELPSRTDNGSALIVIYSDDIDASLVAVEAAGGEIIKNIFEFPGGRRFQFLDTTGNELAVWTKI